MHYNGYIINHPVVFSYYGGSSPWSIKFSQIFFFASLRSFICLQAVYQLSGPGCKYTWSGCPSYHASHLHYPRASEQGNVIGSVRIYIYIYICVQKKFVIERTRDLIYLKFVATDFFLKIINLSVGENSGDLA